MGLMLLEWEVKTRWVAEGIGRTFQILKTVAMEHWIASDKLWAVKGHSQTHCPIQLGHREKNQVEEARWVFEPSWHFPVERDLVPGSWRNQWRDKGRFEIQLRDRTVRSSCQPGCRKWVRNVETQPLMRFSILSWAVKWAPRDATAETEEDCRKGKSAGLNQDLVLTVF